MSKQEENKTVELFITALYALAISFCISNLFLHLYLFALAISLRTDWLWASRCEVVRVHAT